jgi:hypothetical protein
MITRTPRIPEPDTRLSLWANVAIDDVNLQRIDPERVEELRAMAILANDKVRMRNESQTPDGDVDWWCNFGRHYEDLCLMLWFRPETGIAYIQTTGCWEGRVLAADIGIKAIR